jgi:hypothetical protein
MLIQLLCSRSMFGNVTFPDIMLVYVTMRQCGKFIKLHINRKEGTLLFKNDRILVYLISI